MGLYLCFFLFFSSIALIFSQKFHFLSVLLIMELMTLSLFILSSFIFGTSLGVSCISFCLVFIVFGVYEAANGLGVLVSRTRSNGLDSLSTLFSLGF
uniref:NADH-ubiquinone oxidoreductase chain 4L n=1 Tax=Semelidae sp. STW-2017 TaxID=1969324 RepID=A0A1U9XPD5_9BIVA|nr:NADH dehydrogenase subunit 4L [Semelidae sp. STW-2017]